MRASVKQKRIAPLLEERAASAEQTRRNLDAALDRFRHHKLIRLRKGAKLTVRNLALEAGVSKDTPLSRFPKGHPKAGEHRFPGVVARFREMKAGPLPPPLADPRDEKISELRQTIKTKDSQLIAQARTINRQDQDLYETRERNLELESQNAQLRREAMKVISIGGRKKGGR